MNHRITFTRAWPYFDHKRNRRTMEPGAYSVPEQLSKELADLAVSQGVARMHKIELPAAVAPNIAADEALETSNTQRSKGKAPRNKSRGRAPENKTTLV